MMRFAKTVAVVLTIAAFTPAFAQPELNAGRQLLKQGQIQKALAALQTAVAKSPKNAEAWFWLGEAYLQSGKPDSADFAAEKILALDRKLVSGYLLSAKAHLARKNSAAAIERLQTGLKYDKKNAAMLVLLGNTLAASDSLDRAVIVLSSAKLLEPNNPTIHEALGDVYMKQPGAAGVGILQYEQAAEIDSVRAELQYKLAKAYFSQRRYNEAARALQKTAKLDTTNQAALFELAKLYFAAKQYANAAAHFQTYVRRNPNSREAWPMYLEALYSSKQYAEVPAVAQQVLKFEPNSVNALKMLAHAQFERREYDQAIATYQQLSQKEALTVDELKRLGQAYVETKRDSLALGALEEVSRIEPNDADVYGDLGVIYMRQRQFEKSAAAFEKRFKLDSTAVSAYINYALCQMALSKWDLSRVALRRALRQKPDYVKGHLYLARSYTQIDSFAQARRECETVVALEKKDPTISKAELAEAHGLIGLAFLLEKKYPEALEALNASIRFVDNDPQTRLWRAQTYALSGKREEAIAEYRVVLRLDPKNETAKKDLAMLTR
jgi:tetratricopeptide (TPR) repeat protein